MSDDSEREEAQANECQVPAFAAGQSTEAEDEFRPFDDISDGFSPQPTYATQADGLPGEVANSKPDGSNIPPLSPDTLICMGIFDVFVLRDSCRRIVARVPQGLVERRPDGTWWAPWMALVQNHMDSLTVEQRALIAERHRAAQGGDTYPFVRNICEFMEYESTPGHDDWIEVEPIRPACKHYVRVMGESDFDDYHKAVYRLCAARRTTEGAFMSVRDSGIWACDMRSPRDISSEEREIDKFDVRKIAEGKARVMVPMFKEAK